MKNDTVQPATTGDAPLEGPAARLVSLGEQIGRLIDEEDALIRSGRISEAEALTGEKNRLAAEYHETLRILQKEADRWLGPAGSPRRERLRTASDALRRRLRDHARLVLRCKALTEGIIRTIGEEVQKRRQPLARYGPAGRSSTLMPEPTSLAIDRQL
ncbi:MAG: hypothetical protein D6757_04480 [Alphaproteobacteria bacterium]|nr:MAG: hypothetical protein D6757_04480 [Alphaproteobacteria bacterium]